MTFQLRVGRRNAVFVSEGRANANSLLPYHNFPGGVIATNCRVKVTKDDELVYALSNGSDSVQMFIEVLSLISSRLVKVRS